MSQDFTDDCFAPGHVVQTDQQNIENNFAALKSSFSGAVAPTNTFAGMWWFDTDAHILKERDEANNAWLHIWDLANNKPIIANLSNEITGAMIAAAVKDPAVGTAGLRTLGDGAQQAGAGDEVALNTAKNTNATHTGDVTGSVGLTIGAGKVSQPKLKTSMGSVSNTGETMASRTLPGGEYGFYPQIKRSSGTVQVTIGTSTSSTYVTIVRLC